MNKRLGKKIWIDDNPDREKTAKELGYEFVNVWKGDLQAIVENLLTGKERKQVVLDHVLDKTATTNPVFRRGSTIAEAIKEAWPFCPVIGVTTGMTQLKRVDQRTRHTYDAFFPYDGLSDYLDQIDSIEQGFASIADSVPSDSDDIIALLKPPDIERKRLVEALPHDLKKWKDKSVASRLHSWVNQLLNRPGFLYDGLSAATFLGLNESGLAKVEKTFHRAKYSGVFSVDSNPRWWAGMLTEQLYKQLSPGPGEFSWNVGRRLDGITRRFYSECYACDDETPPDTVAYLDRESDERQPMHLKHTVLHPGYKRELFFEDIRMMKDD